MAMLLGIKFGVKSGSYWSNLVRPGFAEIRQVAGIIFVELI